MGVYGVGGIPFLGEKVVGKQFNESSSQGCRTSEGEGETLAGESISYNLRVSVIGNTPFGLVALDNAKQMPTFKLLIYKAP